MATVTGNVKVDTSFTQTNSTGLPTSLALTGQLRANSTYTNASSGSDKTDLLYYKSLALDTTGTTLDLTSITDPFGGSVNMARVRVFECVNTSTTDGQTVTVGNAAANSWTSLISGTGTIVVHPSTSTNANCGRVIFEAPNTTGYVTGASNKNLKLVASTNTITTFVLLAGCSA